MGGEGTIHLMLHATATARPHADVDQRPALQVPLPPVSLCCLACGDRESLLAATAPLNRPIAVVIATQQGWLTCACRWLQGAEQNCEAVAVWPGKCRRAAVSEGVAIDRSRSLALDGFGFLRTGYDACAQGCRKRSPACTAKPWGQRAGAPARPPQWLGGTGAGCRAESPRAACDAEETSSRCSVSASSRRPR